MKVTFRSGNKRNSPSQGYEITDRCIACDLCKAACTSNAIIEGEPYRIDPCLCLHCGRCIETCPEDAIISLWQDE